MKKKDHNSDGPGPCGASHGGWWLTLPGHSTQKNAHARSRQRFMITSMHTERRTRRTMASRCARDDSQHNVAVLRSSTAKRRGDDVDGTILMTGAIWHFTWVGCTHFGTVLDLEFIDWPQDTHGSNTHRRTLVASQKHAVVMQPPSNCTTRNATPTHKAREPASTSRL